MENVIKILFSLSMTLHQTYQQDTVSSWGPATQTASGITIKSVRFIRSKFRMHGSNFMERFEGVSKIRCASECLDSIQCVALTFDASGWCRIYKNVLEASPERSRLHDQYEYYMMNVRNSYFIYNRNSIYR